ncbi:MAG: iron chelate uptake ABC transporter family permease subunit [Oscillospiraceae bacterium]|jgi:iron complex transport system permease protein|nr:iron chelate uptake ABC transporter family permease subunit [Oscillospiraceae bacterium]
MSARSVKRLNARGLAALFAGPPLLLAVSALYIYSRTYAKSSRLGIEMTPAAFESIIGRALPALAGMCVAAALTAIVSLVFQTVTQSRLLTPSMLGFDSVFVTTQTLLVFLFGSRSEMFANPYLNYLTAAGAMIAVSTLMYGAVLRRGRDNIVFLLMFGLVLSGILRSGSGYIQVIMDAEDFNRVRAATSVTVNNMNTDIILPVLPIMLFISAALLLRHRTYNVMSLGPEQAKSLGVPYEREANVSLLLIAAGMSVATALIGSLTFLGLLSVNAARELLKTHRHLPLFIGSAVIASLLLVSGQGAAELLQGALPVTAIIDLAGCSYMFYLILRENRL